MDGPRIALKVNDRDNVATIFANGIHNGSEVELRKFYRGIDYVFMGFCRR